MGKQKEDILDDLIVNLRKEHPQLTIDQVTKAAKIVDSAVEFVMGLSPNGEPISVEKRKAIVSNIRSLVNICMID